jgi:hypothetical protein
MMFHHLKGGQKFVPQVDQTQTFIKLHKKVQQAPFLTDREQNTFNAVNIASGRLRNFDLYEMVTSQQSN